MGDFTASNGIPVTLTADGRLIVEHADHTYPATIAAGEHVDALREFFRAEEDDRFERWRWPENENYIVYREVPGNDWVRVWSESNALMVRVGREKALHNYVDRTIYENAARAYFDAHPEPKPWHDAKPGEVWAFTIDGLEGEFPASLRTSGEWEWAEGGPVNVAPGGLTAARRIWPEVD